MRKITTLLTLLLLCVVGAQAQSGLKLTFDKPGSATNNITVNVTDLNGTALTGVTATLESTSCTEFKTGSATALSRTTNSVLAPNAGYANSQDAEITYTFRIEGLTSDFKYNATSVDVYALTGGGSAQGNNGYTTRTWNITVATGETVADLADFTTLTSCDICTVTEQDGDLYHKSWESGIKSTQEGVNTLYVKVTLHKTDAQGCFAGIGALKLIRKYPFELSTEENPKWYFLKINNQYYVKSNTATSTSKSETDPAYLFAFIGDSYDSFVLKNGDGKYIDVKINTGNGWSMAARVSDTEKSSFAIHEENFEEGTFRLSHDSEMNPGRDMFLGRLYNSDYPNGLVVFTDLKTDNGGIFTIEEGPATITVPYITSLSELSNSKAYYIYSDRGDTDAKSYLTTYNGSLASNALYYDWYLARATDTKGRFSIYEYDGQTYLYSLDDNKFIVGTGAESSFPETGFNLTDKGYAPRFYAQLGTNSINTTWNTSLKVSVSNWDTPDEGNLYYIEEIEDLTASQIAAIEEACENYFHPSASLSYIVVDNNGIEKARADGLVAVPGTTITVDELPASLKRGFCSYTGDPITIVSGENTFTATVSYDLPFEISTDFATAKWYYMTIRGTKYVRADASNLASRVTSSNETIYGYATKSTNELSDEYRWAFIGNPYDNFLLINRAWGEGYYLHGSSYPAMEQFDPTDGSTGAAWGHWTIYTNTNTSGSGWGFRCQEGGNYYLNDSGGVGMLQYWNSSSAVSDLGSSLAVKDVNNELRSALASASPDLSAYSLGTGLGQYTVDVDAYNALQEEASALAANTSATDDQLYAKYLEIKNVTPAINQPAGKFITIYNEARGAYMGTAASGKHPNASSTDAAGIYYVTADGANVVSYDQGKYLQNAAGVPCDMTAGEFTFSDAGNGKYYVNCGGYLVIWTSASDRLSSPNEYAVMTLEEVTELPIALANCKEYLKASEDVFYTTLYMPVKVKITGAEVYKVVEGAEANTLDMELIADGVVPANTGVILKNDTGAATATICTDESTETSVLTGTAPAIVKPEGDVYVLSVANEKLGFYKFAGETMKGFRAYYAPETSSDARGFVLNLGGTTGIGSSLVTGNSSQVYDLQGRRVIVPAKGLYIINGKKVVK